jgi:hypothetical protein
MQQPLSHLNWKYSNDNQDRIQYLQKRGLEEYRAAYGDVSVPFFDLSACTFSSDLESRACVTLSFICLYRTSIASFFLSFVLYLDLSSPFKSFLPGQL